jgi:hypothetical protein|tara:strand:- start:208 stop:432 length:225 start_codon:yes stop_codon:yes gene_type:complete
MANLQEIANKFRVSDNFLNSKEDGLLIVASSLNDIIGELTRNDKRGIDENQKQSIITKLEKLGEFCKEVKNSTF